MKFKDGVSTDLVHWRVIEGMMIAADLWNEFGKELVITSTTDGKHGRKSFHYFGFAFDGRTWYFKKEQKPIIMQELQDRLSELDPRFDVVFEKEVKDKNGKIIKGEHAHVELDIRKARPRRDNRDRNLGPVGNPWPTHPPFRSGKGQETGEEGGS